MSVSGEGFALAERQLINPVRVELVGRIEVRHGS